MKTFVIVCLLCLTAAALARPKETYSDRFDNINLDEILENRRLLIPYIKCALDQGKCSADGKEMKDHLREAMETDCEKCTEKQKKGSRKAIRHLIKNEKDYWEQLKAKYDPEAKYSVKYEEEAAKEK